MSQRIKSLIKDLPSRHIDAFLVLKDINIQYLTGFPASESWLFVTPRKTFYITDFRYVLAAKKGLKNTNIIQYNNSIYDSLFEIAKNMKVKTIGFDDRHLSLAQYSQLQKHCPKSIKLKRTRDCVEQFRELKDKEEINLTLKSLALHKKAHHYLKRIVRPGVTERYVLNKLTDFVKQRGAGFSFDPIVASGPNSCYPHASVTDRKIRLNEPVLIDMGIDLSGYKSDLTRMFFLGKIPKLVGEVNDKVSVAQQKAIQSIKAGVKVSEIDYQARNYLEKNKLAKFFGHALGHGVGLEIHENPRLSQKNSSVLKEGMIITVEPAVYIPNKFGIRIEDMVLVTKKGCKVLSDDIH